MQFTRPSSTIKSASGNRADKASLLLFPLNMHGTGCAVNFATEHFHPATPVNIPINGFGPGHRIRIVGVPAPNARRFWVNLNTPSDTAFHFNPRFDEKCVVRNNTRGKKWQHEERFAEAFPFNHGHIFTIEFIANGGHVDIFYNGRLFTRFQERDDPHHISMVQVDGDVHVHSIHVSSA